MTAAEKIEATVLEAGYYTIESENHSANTLSFEDADTAYLIKLRTDSHLPKELSGEYVEQIPSTQNKIDYKLYLFKKPSGTKTDTFTFALKDGEGIQKLTFSAKDSQTETLIKGLHKHPETDLVAIAVEDYDLPPALTPYITKHLLPSQYPTLLDGKEPVIISDRKSRNTASTKTNRMLKKGPGHLFGQHKTLITPENFYEDKGCIFTLHQNQKEKSVAGCGNGTITMTSPYILDNIPLRTLALTRVVESPTGDYEVPACAILTCGTIKLCCDEAAKLKGTKPEKMTTNIVSVQNYMDDSMIFDKYRDGAVIASYIYPTIDFNLDITSLNSPKKGNISIEAADVREESKGITYNEIVDDGNVAEFPDLEIIHDTTKLGVTDKKGRSSGSAGSCDIPIVSSPIPPRF